MRLEDLQTPALLIRLDRVRTNVQRMLALLRGEDRWRPHVKTSKIPEVLDLLLAAGLRAFKCATTREAAVLLARAEEPIDLLIAFPHHGANLTRIGDLACAFPGHRLAVLTEDPEHAARARALGVGLFVDVSPPGYLRTGIPVEDRGRIAAAVRAAGPALRGLHYYDGHIASGAPEQRGRQVAPLYDALLALVAELGRPELELITSGTPTFEQALAYQGFAGHRHRISPGTVVYSDARTEELGVQGFSRAVHVLARVVSAPQPRRVTCDAGSKALDAAAGDPCAIVEGWPSLVALTPSEEHLPLRVDAGVAPPLGALLQLLPRHVCPTVNLADEAVLLDGEDIVGIVAVAARGHETVARG